jgi:hypothetical protein
MSIALVIGLIVFASSITGTVAALLMFRWLSGRWAWHD